MLIFAHRGSSGTEPENTLRAFRQAITDGADGIELDLHATADGIPVVIHDADLARTTNKRGIVPDLTLAEVKEADAGQGETVPTFREVLDLVGDRLQLYVEVKQPNIEQIVYDTLTDYPTARVIIASFDKDILRTYRALDPDREIWLIAMTASRANIAFCQEIGATTLSLFHGVVTEKVAHTLDAADLDLAVWTINRPKAAKRAKFLGAAAICTDHPATIIPALNHP